MLVLSTAQIDTFHRDGYLLLKNAIPQRSLDALIEVISAEVDRRARDMHAAGEISDLCENESFARRWYQVWRQRGGEQDVLLGWHACMFSRPLYDLWVHPAILDIVEDLIGPELQINGDFWMRPKLDFVRFK